MEDRKGRSMKTPIYLWVPGVDLVDLMDLVPIHGIRLSYITVVRVDQDRQVLIPLIHFVLKFTLDANIPRCQGPCGPCDNTYTDRKT
jgi:hypothetical protein